MKTNFKKTNLFVGTLALALIISFSFSVQANTNGNLSNTESAISIVPDGDKSLEMKCGGEKKETTKTSSTVSEGSKSTTEGKCGTDRY